MIYQFYKTSCWCKCCMYLFCRKAS